VHIVKTLGTTHKPLTVPLMLRTGACDFSRHANIQVNNGRRIFHIPRAVAIKLIYDREEVASFAPGSSNGVECRPVTHAFRVISLCVSCSTH